MAALDAGQDADRFDTTSRGSNLELIAFRARRLLEKSGARCRT